MRYLNNAFFSLRKILPERAKRLTTLALCDTERNEDILRTRHCRGAKTQELVRTPALFTENRTRHNEEFAVVLDCESRGDEASREFFGFDDERCFAKTGHDAIAFREGPVSVFRFGLFFRKQRTARFQYLSCEVHVRPRIQRVTAQTASGHGDGRE